MANRKSKKLPPFIYITKEMFRSNAFKQLTNSARTTYLLLQDQVRSAEQTQIICPYRFAAQYMDQKTFGRAIKQLAQIGFIEKHQKGGLFRRTNVYRFVNAWRYAKEKV